MRCLDREQEWSLRKGEVGLWLTADTEPFTAVDMHVIGRFYFLEHLEATAPSGFPLPPRCRLPGAMEQRQSSRSARHWSETCYSLGALEGKALGTEMQRAAISVLHKSANFYLGTEMSSTATGEAMKDVCPRTSKQDRMTRGNVPRVPPTSPPAGFLSTPMAHVLSLCCLLQSRVCAPHGQACLPSFGWAETGLRILLSL